MKVLILGSPRRKIIEVVETAGDTVFAMADPLFPNSSLLVGIDVVVSYGYRHVIPASVLAVLPRFTSMNLHVSLLPWNRGADPNLWSYLEDTPKGVTIHLLDEAVDTGDILLQEESPICENDTLRTSYNRLSQQIEHLFERNWHLLREGKIVATPQTGRGSYHRERDRECYVDLLTSGWDTPVRALVGCALGRGREDLR